MYSHEYGRLGLDKGGGGRGRLKVCRLGEGRAVEDDKMVKGATKMVAGNQVCVGVEAPEPAKKLTPAEFALRAIDRLKTGMYAGIHIVWSGFNDAFEQYFGLPKGGARAELDKLVAAKVVSIRGTKGGALMFKYDPTWKPEKQVSTKTSPALDKILA